MISWTASLSMQLCLVGMVGSYQEAYERAAGEGKPLLVLVGADWCPGCRTMKDEMIPELRRAGGLSEIVFTTVNTDDKPVLTRRLLRGSSIPQLVLYTRTERGWRRSQLTGVHTPALIRQFIRAETAAARAAAQHDATVPAAAQGDNTMPPRRSPVMQ